jgi:hypothetical protein
MAQNSRSWLDALTDGHILRDALSLLAQFIFGIFYFTLLAAGFATAIGLSFILIGIPLLLFVMASTRTLAAMDRAVMGSILDIDVPPVQEDIDMRGANLGERMGMLLGSGVTWRSMLYLLLKLPIGIAAISILMLLLPLLAFEVLILAPLTIDLRLLTVRLQRWSARGLFAINSAVLPNAKGKRAAEQAQRISRLIDEYEEQPRYVLGDDGEISVAKRGTN